MLLHWFLGTFTLAGGRFAISENIRIFIMVGICGGFTTFSSFSLETFDLLREGTWAKALANLILSVVLCLFSVAAGPFAAQHFVNRATIAETHSEEFTGRRAIEKRLWYATPTTILAMGFADLAKAFRRR